MASYHFSINSKRKGRAADHANYIAREQRHARSPEDTDLVAGGHGNMPAWAGEDPLNFWKAADRYERENGSACREWVVALPRELTPTQQRHLVQELIEKAIVDKPYQYAIHNPTGSLDGAEQPHAHIIHSDRIPDGIDRSAEQHFRRYNPKNPGAGGCRKDSGGKTPADLRDAVTSLRKTWADIQNEALAQQGSGVRVDHRSLTAQGLKRLPESHLGPVRIKQMTTEQRKIHQDMRDRPMA